MLVCFSGNSRNINQDIEVYRSITNAINETGAVIAKNWIEAAVHLARFPSDELWWKEMCADVQESIEDADVMIAEVSGRSTFGVGYEMALALKADKYVLALVKEGEYGSYVRGLTHPKLTVAYYRSDNVSAIVGNFLNGIK